CVRLRGRCARRSCWCRDRRARPAGSKSRVCGVPRLILQFQTAGHSARRRLRPPIDLATVLRRYPRPSKTSGDAMLKGIDPILGPELLHTLRAMGHGDDIVIADSNFPATTNAKRLIRLDGVDAVHVADAILSLIPLDTFVDSAAF